MMVLETYELRPEKVAQMYPHQVAISIDKVFADGRFEVYRSFFEDREGKFSVELCKSLRTHFFQDPNTAFEFKMLFG